MRLIASVLVLPLALFAGSAWADGPARKRPLSDFLDAQGSHSIFIPPVPDYLGWLAPKPGVKPIDGLSPPDPEQYDGGNAGSCDYAGLANQWLIENNGPDLGTSVDGSFTERELADGRVLFKVELHTKNALTFGYRTVSTEDFPFGNSAEDPLIFGARAEDVLLNDATPGIGECHALFAWKQPANLPILDIVDVVFFPPLEVSLVTLSFRANATGPLTADFDPKHPELAGEPGRLTISQTGILHTAFMGATADGFPAEYVRVRKIGN